MRRHNLGRRVAHAHNRGICHCKSKTCDLLSSRYKISQRLADQGKLCRTTLLHSLPIKGGVQLIYKNQVLQSG